MKQKTSVENLVKTALLSVLAFVVMFLEFPLPLFPPFLKIDMSDMVALVTAFAMGPVSGVVVELVKNLLHLMQTSTGGVGELANFIIGAALVFPAGYIYSRKKTVMQAVMGLILGTVCMALVGAFANYYILIPFYKNFMPIEQIIAIAQVANRWIVDIKTYVLYAVIPFNLIKGILVSGITLLIYKKMASFLKLSSR